MNEGLTGLKCHEDKSLMTEFSFLGEINLFFFGDIISVIYCHF